MSLCSDRRPDVLDVTIDAVRRRLEEIVALGSDEIAEAGARISSALDDSLRVALLDLLAGVATEVSSQLDDAHVEVRVGGDPPVVVVYEVESTTAPSEDHSARLTLRLPPDLKDRITERADRAGVSVNTWVVQALQRGVERPGPRPTGRRLQGRASS
jgi:hypothetical protein